MFLLKKSLALATVAVLVAAIGTGCSGNNNNKPTTANAKVAVSSAAVQGDIQSIKLTITGEPDTPGAPGFPIVASLSKAPAGNVWTGSITNIPASAAPGQKRTFTASAFDGPNGGGNKIYEGTTVATVVAGETAQVTIILNETNPPAGPANYAPVIDAITSTAALLLPGQTGTFTVAAHDPDDATHLGRPQFDGSPLAYLWSASCDNGTLTIASPTSASTAFTAPSAQSAICTVSIKVSETALANNSSVTTYFTVTVNGNFGNADIFAFPNTSPLVTVRGDFRYYFFTDTAPGGVPAQQGDLFFHATDPDGDNVRFDLSGKCSDAGFDGTGQLPGGAVAIDAANFSAITLTTSGGGAGFDFNPFFGHSGGQRYADPNGSCQFKIDVHDLCTSGNCGPTGSQGSKPDGADRGGATTGFLNAPAPTQPKRAPTIVRVTVPNQSGSNVPGTPNTWDPKKFVVVLPGATYNLSLDAEDTYEAGPLTIGANCSSGTATTVSTTTPGGQKTLHWEGTWTAPAALVVGMQCELTVTSSASSLGTATIIHFAGSDPCIGQPNGTACDDGNACTSGTTCTNNVCGGGTTVTCSASDQCHVAGVCNPGTGTCSNPAAPDNTLCNADSNGCTVSDFCSAGVCTAGGAAACNTPPGQCFNPAGVCDSTGNNTFTCGYSPSPSGTSCSDGNLCTQTDACNGAGVCVGSNPVNCAGGQCSTGGTCNPATGTCQGGSNQPNGTPCNDGLACTTTDSCQGGVCTGTGSPCGPGETCNEPGGTCSAPAIVPQVAKLLELANSVGLGVDTAGNSYVTGTLVTPPKVFDGTTLTSAGGADAFIGSYTSNGTKRWVVNYGDGADQLPTSLAVSDSAVLANGRFSGAIGALNASTATWDYLLFVNSGSGAISAARAIDSGTGGAFFSVGANPTLGLFAVCGTADKLAADTTAGAPGSTWATVAGANTYGGSTDILIGVYNSAGVLQWAKQIGTAAGEQCSAVTIDDVGNVWAAGVYSGSGNLTLAGATPLPNPGSSFRRHIWVAKFDGTSGAGLAQAAFGGGAGTHVINGIAVDASSNVYIAGAFTNSLPFTAASGGATSCTAGANGCFASSGGQDGFVAKLSSGLAPLWMTRIGVSTGDDVIRGLALDSAGNPAAAGLLNGASTASTITPSSTATAPVGDANITSAGGSSSSYFVKLPGATGTFSGTQARTTGNNLASNGNRIAINAKGVGAAKDVVSYNGDFSGGTLNFGGTTSPITAPAGAATFLTFGKIQ